MRDESEYRDGLWEGGPGMYWPGEGVIGVNAPTFGCIWGGGGGRGIYWSGEGVIDEDGAAFADCGFLTNVCMFASASVVLMPRDGVRSARLPPCWAGGADQAAGLVGVGQLGELADLADPSNVVA